MESKTGEASYFRQKAEDLSSRIEREKRVVHAKKGGMSKDMLYYAVIPVLVGLVLYFCKPKFVQTEKEGEYHRDMKKMLLWTLVISAVGWGGVWAFKKYKK